MREPALTSISTDSLSSPMSQLLMTETTDDKYSFSDGELNNSYTWVPWYLSNL